MNKTETRERLHKIIKDNFKFTDSELNGSDSLEDLRFDSLDVIEFIMECEGQFEVQLPDNVCDKHLGEDWRAASLDKYVDLIYKLKKDTA